MDCRDFDRLLDTLLEGHCAQDDWQHAQAHLAACARCGRLFDALAGRGASLHRADEDSLTASILARTSGAACAAARDRLCDYGDGRLNAFDGELIAAHLGRCEACSRLAHASALAGFLLPSFAEIQPPASFTAEVLRETCDRPALPSLGDRVVAWLQRAALRPRFSVEAAYVLTLVLLLILGDPVKAFREASTKGTAYVQPRVALAAHRLADPLDTARALGSHTLDALATKSHGVRAASDDVVASVLAWWSRSVEAPVRAAIAEVATWVRITLEAIREAARRLGVVGTTPSRSGSATEPSGAAVRLPDEGHEIRSLSHADH